MINAHNSAIRHAMTVDVEDYFHVAALSKAIAVDEWETWPARVESNTQQLLDVFSEAEVKATFFVLGWVAERYPSLVEEIHKRGHEIASHGYSHQLIYTQTPAVFREETHKSKRLLEDISGQPVTGYRAASYSITKQSLWALDILAELGFTWDSSIYPIYHDRYGIPGTPTSPYHIITPSGHRLTEYPLTTSTVAGVKLPAAGGGYFRQYPYWLFQALFKRAENRQQQSQIFYLHPWEIDPGQPRITDISWLSTFRHYRNLDQCQNRLQQLLQQFDFAPISETVALTSINEEIDLSKPDSPLITQGNETLN